MELYISRLLKGGKEIREVPRPPAPPPVAGAGSGAPPPPATNDQVALRVSMAPAAPAAAPPPVAAPPVAPSQPSAPKSFFAKVGDFFKGLAAQGGGVQAASAAPQAEASPGAPAAAAAPPARPTFMSRVKGFFAKFKGAGAQASSRQAAMTAAPPAPPPAKKGFFAKLGAFFKGLFAKIGALFRPPGAVGAPQPAPAKPPEPGKPPAPPVPPQPAPEPTGQFPPLQTAPDLPEYRAVKLKEKHPGAAAMEATGWMWYNHPEMWVPKGADGDLTREQYYKLMTWVIGILRANGFDAHRVVNHESQSIGSPGRYGSDAVVCNGRIYDVVLGADNGHGGPALIPQYIDNGPYVDQWGWPRRRE